MAARGRGGHHCPGLVLAGSFGAVFAPGEPDQEGVEDGQQGQADGEVDGGDPVELVGDESEQQADEPGIGPQLSFSTSATSTILAMPWLSR